MSNELVLCGKCGFIGMSHSLSTVNPKEKLKEGLVDLVKSNNMLCRCCPECGSTFIFYKNQVINANPINFSIHPGENLTGQIQTNAAPTSPEGWVEYQELDEGIEGVLTSAMSEDLQEDVVGDRKMPKIIRNKPKKEMVRQKERRPPPPKYKKKCDLCRKEFSNKDDSGFSTRCEVCIQDTVRKLG